MAIRIVDLAGEIGRELRKHPVFSLFLVTVVSLGVLGVAALRGSQLSGSVDLLVDPERLRFSLEQSGQLPEGRFRPDAAPGPDLDNRDSAEQLAAMVRQDMEIRGLLGGSLDPEALSVLGIDQQRVRLLYTANDPELAASIVEQLGRQLVQTAPPSSGKASQAARPVVRGTVQRSALARLDSELQEAKQVLADRQQRRQRTAENQLDPAWPQLELDIQALEEQISERTAMYRQLENQRNLIVRQIEELSASPDQSDAGPGTGEAAARDELDPLREGPSPWEDLFRNQSADLARLRERLARLRAQYTDAHPDVVMVNREIVELRRAQNRTQQQIDSWRAGSSPQGAGSESAMGKLMGQKREVDERLARIAGEQRSDRSELARARAAQESLEQNNAAVLLADQQIAAARARVEQLESERNQTQGESSPSAARLGGEWTEVGGDARSEEAAESRSAHALSPYDWHTSVLEMRLLSGLGVSGMLMAGLPLGLLAPFLVFLVWCLLDPRMRSPALFTGDTGVPVLAVLPPMPTPAELRKRRSKAVAYLVYLVGLIAVYIYLARIRVEEGWLERLG